jgi:hypothetical protein
MNGFKAGPKNHQENRPQARISILRVGLENGPEDLVLPRVLRCPVPHEGDDIRPCAELPQERLSPVKILQQLLVLIGLKFLFE